jgi:pSer/pThr/pTyr-binding forkhead associated (FHA) protein
MLVRLFVIRGKANKEAVAVALPAVIGRSREADLTIIHPMISRRHCQLFESDGLVKVRDLGSLNGTYLGGEQIQEAFLPPGGILTVGPLVFRVEYEASPAAISREPSVNDAQSPGASSGDILVMEDAQSGSDNDSQKMGGIPLQTDLETCGKHPEPATEPCQPRLLQKTDPGDQGAGDGCVPASGIAPPDGAVPDFSLWQQAADGRNVPSSLPCDGNGPAETNGQQTGPAVQDLDANDVTQTQGDQSVDRKAWADAPPPFTVVRRSDDTPCAPVLLNSDTGGETPQYGGGSDGDLQASDAPLSSQEEHVEAVKAEQARRGWWFFRR